MPLNSVRVLILLIALAISLCLCGNSIAMANTLGGIKESSCGAENSVQIDELARFAVEEHNKKENAILEFVRVLHAKEQVVAGTLHHLTLEAIDAGKKKVYDAKIYVKPWLGVKELQEFTHKSDSTSFTSSDLGANREGHAPGWREVPVHDPVIKDAANQAVSSIQQRSNSLVPYELVDIVHAKADVADDLAKFNLVLKLKRGDKEEKFNVEVHKSVEGNFVLNQMKHEHEE